jgi:hypothetical protein
MGIIYKYHMAYEIVIGGRFKVGKKIGSGSFGEIHTGILLQQYRHMHIHK